MTLDANASRISRAARASAESTARYGLPAAAARLSRLAAVTSP